MKQIITGIVAALAISAMAENTVKVTKFHQSQPYSGKATVWYTVGGTVSEGAFAEIVITAGGTSAAFTNETVVTGDNSNVIDFASSFGGALALTNASFVVTIGGEAAEIRSMQLWANGPYWAECNVGATNPEDVGYYFWWGDTVGYWHLGHDWVSVADGTTHLDSATASATSGKGTSTLLSEGWIDSTGNLVAAHDAATAHLGAPWRMPTKDEIYALINKCTVESTTRNGIEGWLFTGKGDYSDRSIFFPVVDPKGYGGTIDYYWSSTPSLVDDSYARALHFYDLTKCGNNSRGYTYPVRPVRGSAE